MNVYWAAIFVIPVMWRPLSTSVLITLVTVANYPDEGYNNACLKQHYRRMLLGILLVNSKEETNTLLPVEGSKQAVVRSSIY
jgi:hypothetical protein